MVHGLGDDDCHLAVRIGDLLGVARLRRFAIGLIKSSTKDGIAQKMRQLCRSPRLVFDYLRMSLNSKSASAR